MKKCEIIKKLIATQGPQRFQLALELIATHATGQEPLSAPECAEIANTALDLNLAPERLAARSVATVLRDFGYKAKVYFGDSVCVDLGRITVAFQFTKGAFDYHVNWTIGWTPIESGESDLKADAPTNQLVTYALEVITLYSTRFLK